jgi:hypothetical protein
MRVYTPDEIFRMDEDERLRVMAGDFGASFHRKAAEHIAWIYWAPDETSPVLGQASAFILHRPAGPILVTAAHVYRGFVRDKAQHGPLYCRVQNTEVADLSAHLIDCGNLSIPVDSDRALTEPDIATFRLPPGAVERIGKRPVEAVHEEWPAPPFIGQQAMIAGFPGRERVALNPREMSFGFYSVATPITSMTEHQITCRFERSRMVDSIGRDLPPVGYGLGGISGGPLLVPEYENREWVFRLGGVISEAQDERPPEQVIFESVVAHRAEYILPDGRIAKVR